MKTSWLTDIWSFQESMPSCKIKSVFITSLPSALWINLASPSSPSRHWHKMLRPSVNTATVKFKIPLHRPDHPSISINVALWGHCQQKRINPPPPLLVSLFLLTIALENKKTILHFFISLFVLKYCISRDFDRSRKIKSFYPLRI